MCVDVNRPCVLKNFILCVCSPYPTVENSLVKIFFFCSVSSYLLLMLTFKAFINPEATSQTQFGFFRSLEVIRRFFSLSQAEDCEMMIKFQILLYRKKKINHLTNICESKRGSFRVYLCPLCSCLFAVIFFLENFSLLFLCVAIVA